MKKLLNTALSIILTVLLVFTVVWAQTGSYTTNNYFYLPEYGAYGTDEYDAYNAAMEVADNQIQSNKESIEAIEADYLVAADLTGYYTKLEIDAFGYISDLSGFDTDDLVEGSVNKYFPGFTSLLADYSFTDNSTNWNTAYGWGDHSTAGYLTTVALDDLSDVNTTGVADGKIIKYDIATSKWIIADDEDTGTTYTAGTGLDLTGTVFSLDASAFDLNDFPADPDADRYLFWNDTTGAITWAEGSGSGVTTFVGLTDTPLAYTGYAGYFPKVNAGETALEFAELTESDITDLGTYLTDITSESIGDLSDVDLTDIADTKILQYNATTSKWECETAPAGGGASQLSDLSDVNTSTPTNRYVLVADGVDFESRALVEADISDLGTYLTDITSESFADLSDIPAHPGVATKILETTADGYQYIDTPSGSGGEANTASNIGGHAEIFKQKEGVDLEFRTLRAGTGIDLYNSAPTGTWDITNCSYDGISKDVSSQDSLPYGVAFNPDGTKMYIVGYYNGTVFQYTLSTPWNVSTATYDNVSKSVSSQESTPYGVTFNPDGTKMYIVGNSNDTVFQYTLSTPWNVGTATYDSISKSVSSEDSSPRDVTFNPDGSKMYIVGYTNDTVFQYTLSTPWNVGTATYDSISKDVSSQDSSPRGVAFNSDGTKMYIVGYYNGTVYQYTVGGTTEYDYITVDIDIPNDSTKFLDGAGNWNTLVESDISDLGSYLENVSEDTTPELGGEMDAGAHSIGFTLQTVAEADGTTTIDWKLGNHCKVTLGAQNETFTFIAPSNPCNLTLIIVQDATGGRDITWPATVKWLGTEATWTDGGAGKGIVVGFIYDGTNYWGQATPWES